ncbi:tRNA lysidine(34) synthetase TilS [Ornithinimicrobium avium]|uniref:tRNA(Ile)-lysidine synthase n=1 Tax=Ornithinimicrobium avium TaxID=2283195 RepID=A0A345NQ58_9MICO|nr:tRNA lysidine(34) synthetase TilS [Ornithinimicrobium avium]AXH97166.1 tRNA lysidine(34) synthetase TilS [Ornithinimicrobium avium]
MPGPPPAVAAVRVAVRRALTQVPLGPPTAEPLLLVACSGGPDSSALAAGTGFVASRLGWRAGAVVVDHGLQEGSARVAQQAAALCHELGLDPVEVVAVEVVRTGEGPEADARRARYAVLADRADALGARAVLVGHTLEDQAEQVLLGLARGSGARSLSGMPPWRPLDAAADPGTGGALLLRPLLGVTRQQTLQACAELGLEPWQDPHNVDPRYARVRARRALADVAVDLGPGVVAGLARSADLLRDDADALDAAAETAYLGMGDPPWEAGRLRGLPRAVRTRLWRRAALASGSPGTDLTSEHLLAVDGLLTRWRGQGPLHLPGGVQASRTGEQVWIGRPT